MGAIRVCATCGKEKPIFSKGNCLYCAKKNYKPISKTTPRSEEKRKRMKAVHAMDAGIYLEIWNRRLHTCLVCHRILSKPTFANFHHLAEKSSHPEHRHDHDNIVILCWDCHNQHHTKPIELLNTLKSQFLEKKKGII